VQPLELEVERGPAAGQRISLAADWTIGSAEPDSAALRDRWLSPQHARIHSTPGGWAVEDLRSVEGTRVNGHAVREPRTLRPGDTIELGSTRLHVLPDGAQSLADTPGRRADSKAGDLKSDSRRKLDSRRVGAYVVDSLMMLPVALLLWQNGTFVALLVSGALGLTYFFVLESLTGQTLGKALFGLRVVRADGRPLSPQSVSIRTVLRLVDEIAGGLVGLITMLLTGGQRRRLGDLAAGTVVTRSSFPFERVALGGRDLLAFLGYPLLWIAPAVLAFALVPGARLHDCLRAGIATASSEGSCVAGGHVVTAANAGHTLHMPGIDTNLSRAKVEHIHVARLAGKPGFEDGRAALVELKIAVTNSDGEALAFDRAGKEIRLFVPTGSAPVGIPELPPRYGLGSHKPFGTANPSIGPGHTRSGWVRFLLPEAVVQNVTLPGASLEVLLPSHEAGDRYIGLIRLWRASTVKGGTALAELSG
jgi:pSer/pThr/pTyr-binding forkhead associated (FHA) protein